MVLNSNNSHIRSRRTTGQNLASRSACLLLQCFATKVQLGINSVTSQVIRYCECGSIASFVQVLASLNSCLSQISEWSIQGSPWTRSIGVVHGLGVTGKCTDPSLRASYFSRMRRPYIPKLLDIATHRPIQLYREPFIFLIDSTTKSSVDSFEHVHLAKL